MDKIAFPACQPNLTGFENLSGLISGSSRILKCQANLTGFKNLSGLVEEK
jgi:hypothetical protein